MNWFKIVKRDLRSGIFRMSYLAIPLIVMIPGIVFLLYYKAGLRGTWMDFMLYLFQGQEPFALSDIGEKMDIPFFWLLIMAGCLVINLDYPLRDLSSEGLQILIRSQSRMTWYLSKCVWNVASCACYIFLISLSAGIYTLVIGGSLSTAVTPEIGYALFGAVISDELSLSVGQAMATAVILPFLTLLAFSMIQMILCFVMRPINGFFVCFSGMLLSVYWSKVFILGNGAMAIRNAAIADGGIPSTPSVILALFIIIMSVFVGGILFQRYDILKIGE